MSLVYFLSKFSQEALLIELFLIGCLMTSYFGYVLTKKRRYGAAKKNIPDNVVRAFLVELISQAEGFKGQLFGDSFKIEPGKTPRFEMPKAATGGDADSSAEVGLLKKQLTHATTKSEELGASIETLKSDKSALESKLAQAISAASAAASARPAAGGGDNKALLDKIAKLEAKLSEYEVIEDDLANLKQYQQENKQLKAQLAALSGGAPAPALAAVAAAPAAQPEPAAPEPSPIAAAEEAVSAKVDEQKFEEPIAPPASPVGASVADPIPAAAAVAPAPAVPPPATAAPEAAPAAAKKDDKTDSDLLNEFERMLNS